MASLLHTNGEDVTLPARLSVCIHSLVSCEKNHGLVSCEKNLPENVKIISPRRVCTTSVLYPLFHSNVPFHAFLVDVVIVTHSQNKPNNNNSFTISIIKSHNHGWSNLGQEMIYIPVVLCHILTWQGHNGTAMGPLRTPHNCPRVPCLRLGTFNLGPLPPKK
jgi:hypothetical protein